MEQRLSNPSLKHNTVFRCPWEKSQGHFYLYSQMNKYLFSIKQQFEIMCYSEEVKFDKSTLKDYVIDNRSELKDFVLNEILQ